MLYERELMAIMTQYEVYNEAEVVSGCISRFARHKRKPGDVKAMLIHDVQALRRHVIQLRSAQSPTAIPFHMCHAAMIWLSTTSEKGSLHAQLSNVGVHWASSCQHSVEFHVLQCRPGCSHFNQKASRLPTLSSKSLCMRPI